MKAKLFYEVDVPEGLETLAWDEIRQRLGENVKLLHPIDKFPGLLQFTYGDAPKRLLLLKSVLSVFQGHKYDIPRPKALLGHEHLTDLIEQAQTIMKLTPAGAYRWLYLAAAGSDSTVMKRLGVDMANALKLNVSQRGEGDLLVRVRRPLGSEKSGLSPEFKGWEVLIRMTPRPLSARRWRVCDMEGGLNAAVAYSLVKFTTPRPDEVFLNVGCGSGTILIERAAVETASRLIGCDINPEAVECAQKNVDAAGYKDRIELHTWDARKMPLETASIDVVSADLPFGHDVGSHDENITLYPQLLKEAGRVTKPGGRAAFLSHEIRLMENVLNHSEEWELEDILQITINGLNPRIYLLSRN